jgi:hypothetical protein
MKPRITTIQPGDIVRVTLPEFKGRHFIALSLFYDKVEIEVGEFIDRQFIQKKYRNKYITI